MTAPRPIAPARVLAALDVLGWSDDREGSAHVESDGYQVTRAADETTGEEGEQR